MNALFNDLLSIVDVI